VYGFGNTLRAGIEKKRPSVRVFGIGHM